MALTVFSNGAKVHEAFLDRYIVRGRHGTVTDEEGLSDEDTAEVHTWVAGNCLQHAPPEGARPGLDW